MTAHFPTEQVTKTLEDILKKLNLTVSTIMSTSGTYNVVLCDSQAQEKFIIKILQINDQKKLADFRKEATINQLLSKQASPTLQAPKKIYLYEDTLPALAYSLIEGDSLGWYFFYTSKNPRDTVGAKNLLISLNHIQQQTNQLLNILELETFTKSIALQKLENIQVHALRAGLSENLYQACYTIVKAAAWDEKLILAHGDFNPKNIVFTTNQHIAVIDWSDALLANPYYDIAFFWLTCWRYPEFQKDIAQNLNNAKPFWEMVCYWLPKFYALLIDTQEALVQEYAKQAIPLVAKVDNLEYITQAKDYYKKNIPTIIEQAR